MSNETIYALSSGLPPAGVAVIRVSGPQAGEALRALTDRDELPEPRKLSRYRFSRPDGASDIIDEAMAAWFPGPSSFTGEDCVELHTHGGRAVVMAVLDALQGMAGLRMAEPGEFTRRAFDNAKLDLSEAEGLADLIAAETEAQRCQAVRQMEGELGALCLDWRSRLINALAHMEATIDFSDEDLPDILDDNARDAIVSVRTDIMRSLDDGRRGERIRDGIRVAIVGPPNAGKSSLLNLLARRDAAIVSEHAGTTRDIIEVHMDIAGYPVVVSDTAGLRESGDVVEQEGIRRARKAAEGADVRVVMFDGKSWPQIDDISADIMSAGDSTIGLLNKTDAMSGAGPYQLCNTTLLGISVKTGEGIEGLMQTLETMLAEQYGTFSGSVVTRARHREAFTACAAHLARALEVQGAELWAEDLRLAMRELGRVVGQVGVEDLLDVIFSEFCIGK